MTVTAAANCAPRSVVVIGAGIVGVSCALWLQHDGRRVTLLDGNAPGSGASRGNACTIAVHGCIPVNRPGLPLQLPKFAREITPLADLKARAIDLS
ncbi:MAG: FAD-dependent oxidoreductase [Gammaproteobacteria bacterium]